MGKRSNAGKTATKRKHRREKDSESTSRNKQKTGTEKVPASCGGDQETHSNLSTGRRFRCPHSRKFNCTKTYATKYIAIRHGESHYGRRYPCPLAKKFNCKIMYSSKYLATKHGETHYRRFPCPLAAEYSCTKTYTLPALAKRHAEVHGERKKIPCPLAEEFGCERQFFGQQAAQQHADCDHIEEGGFPCPLAQEMNCDKRFITIPSARRHGETHQGPTAPWPCPLAEKLGCIATFKSSITAKQHAENMHARPSICTVPMCRHAVSRFKLFPKSIKLHMKVHESRGDLEGLETYPYPVEVDCAEDEMAEDVMAEDEMAETEDFEDEMAEEIDHIEILPLLEDNEQEWLLSYNSLFSDEHRATIIRINESYRSVRPELRMTLRNKGLNCVGPSAIDVYTRFVTELCPYNARIDVDTAYLRERVSQKTVRLEPRCAACSIQKRFREVLRDYDLLKEDQEHCDHPACFMPTWHKAKFCKKHMIEQLHKPRSLSSNEASLLRDALERAQEKRWTYRSPFEKAVKRKLSIADGRMTGAKLICLDIEFSPVSGKVFEVGLCEYYSGKVLINARVKYDGHDADMHKPRDDAKPAHPFLKAMSTVTANKVYNGGKNTDLLSVHDIAARCREGGVTSESVVLTWHIEVRDLVLLRQLFEEAGYDDILPPDNNCIPMIPQFRKNLPTISGKLVTAKLDVLFPLMFKGHELIGQNHQALADAQQLRLMVMRFVELCKPLEERTQVPRGAGPRQRMIKDWLVLPKGENSSSRPPTGSASDESSAELQDREGGD